MDEPLRRLISSTYADIAALMAVRDRFTSQQWQREMRTILVRSHLAAYFAGNGGRDLSAYADRALGAAIQQQLDYLAGFAAVLDDLSDAQATARALQYTGALKASYSQGKYEVWELPFQPSEGSECGNNCRCIWRLDVIDLEELNADAYWVLSGSESCPTCDARANDSPYRIRGGVLV